MQLKANKLLSARCREVAEYVFDNPDKTYTVIARDLGLSTGRISQIMRSERVLATFPLLAKKRIKGMVPKAIQRYDQLLHQNKNLEVARKVSESVLNSEKVLEPSPIIQINVLSNLSDEELHRKIDSIGQLQPQTIDTEIIE